MAEAEGSHAERRARLGAALDAVDCDLYLRSLVLWVFNVTAGGIKGELTKTHDELAARPWGLCCSRSKARATVRLARKLRLLSVEEARYTSGGQKANEYRLDWEGVDAAATQAAGVTRRHPGVSTEHPPVLTRHPFKEQLFFSSLRKIPEPEPEGPGPRPSDGVKEENGDQDAQTDPLRARLFEEVPELVEAATRLVEPLPPGDLVYGAYRCLTRGDLDSAPRLLLWFRRQLGLARPVAEATEADLLLVMAAGLRAASAPDSAIHKNRPAYSAWIISQRRWYECSAHIPDARRALDQAIARCVTDPLTGPWPPKTRAKPPATQEATR